jgi:hypothetical protein
MHACTNDAYLDTSKLQVCIPIYMMHVHTSMCVCVQGILICVCTRFLGSIMRIYVCMSVYVRMSVTARLCAHVCVFAYVSRVWMQASWLLPHAWFSVGNLGNFCMNTVALASVAHLKCAKFMFRRLKMHAHLDETNLKTDSHRQLESREKTILCTRTYICMQTHACAQIRFVCRYDSTHTKHTHTCNHIHAHRLDRRENTILRIRSIHIHATTHTGAQIRSAEVLQRERSIRNYGGRPGHGPRRHCLQGGQVHARDTCAKKRVHVRVWKCYCSVGQKCVGGYMCKKHALVCRYACQGLCVERFVDDVWMWKIW